MSQLESIDDSLNIDKKSILCVGLCVLDIIHVCVNYPTEDSDRRSKHGRWQRGGNASNTCTVLAQMGTQCEFIGLLSTAKSFEFVIADCQNRGISIDNCVYYDSEPPVSSVILNEATGSRTIIYYSPNIPILKFDDFKKINLSKYKWIHFEGRNPEETSQMMQHIQTWNSNVLAHESKKIRISLELEKIRPETIPLAQYAEIVFLSKDFAQSLGYGDMTIAVHELRKRTRSGTTIICTWGSSGAAALDDNDKLYTCHAYKPPTIIDSLGAGDTFIAATIFALCNEKSIDDAIKFACRIAGAKVGFYGYDHIKDIYLDFLSIINL